MRSCHSFYVAKVFSGSVTEPSSCFTNVYLFEVSASYATDNIGRGAREVISNLNRSCGSENFLNVMKERKSFASCASAFKIPGWSLVCRELLTKKLPMFLSRLMR